MAWKKDGKTDAVVVPQERPVETLTYDALLELKARVDSEVNARSGSELEALKQKLVVVAASQGLTVEELFKKRKKREAKAKYRNPETGDEWSGRGKVPTWLQAKIDAGALRDDFLQ